MITERQYAPNKFQHCSTISKGPPGAGTFLAYYTGEAEMHKSQHVRIHWWSDQDVEAKPIDLEDYTGNPIIIETLYGTSIIYSKFEKLVPTRVEWWQHCSLWQRNLDVFWSQGRPTISVGAPRQLIVDEPGDDKPPTGLGYLPRCHPIHVSDGILLPLYREHAPHFYGVIMHSKNGIDWTYRGAIGKNDHRNIQPTIWRDGTKICSLSRNFSRSVKLYAYYSESLDEGFTWSTLEYAPYYNANNSILAITEDPLIIWNDDNMGRDKISLGSFDMKKPKKIAQIDGYGSYPSATYDKDKLLIAYTTKPNPIKTPGVKSVIKVKQYDLEAIRDNLKKLSWSNPASSISKVTSPWQVIPPKHPK